MAERKRHARPPRLTIREVTDVADPAVGAAHALLRGSFSRSEMLPVADWRNALRERREAVWTDQAWHLLVAERGRRMLGAATGAYLGNVNIGLIGYIAVHPSARALGLGPRLRRTLLRKFEQDARASGHRGLAGLMGEVRGDNPWLRTLVRREGALALDFPYYQPSLGGSREPVPLVLYYQPVTRERRSMGGMELRRLLYTIWRRIFRISRPLSHPEFRRMMSALEGRSRIGQLRGLGAAPRRATSGKR